MLATAVALTAAAGCGGTTARTTPSTDEAASAADSDGERRGTLRPELVHRQLDNGLDVYMVEDHSAPIVTYQSWFEVGSAHERPAGPDEDHGITGISHFFEHLMFRGTEEHPEFFDAVYRLGGDLNAFTWLDETVYWEKIPSRHLHEIIRMEADRLRNLTVDFVSLEAERGVVQSERRLRTTNRPEGRAREVLQARMFERSPYRWTTIGRVPDLNRITVEEATAYGDEHYAPDNAFLVVVGDHEPDQTLSWIREAYGGLEPSGGASEPDFPEEPPQEAERRDRVVQSADPPLVMWGFRAPSASHEDYAVLEVLNQLLAGTKSSRLKRRLVYSDDPALSSLEGDVSPTRRPYIYRWSARMRPDTSVHRLERIFDETVRRLVEEGVGEDELQRAVATLQSHIVRYNRTPQQKGQLIGFGLRAMNDPYALFDRLETYEQVTAEEVRQAAETYLQPEKRTWVTVVAPSRFDALLERFVETADPLPQPVGKLAQRAAKLLDARRKLARQRTQLAHEEQALSALDERAERALSEASEAEAKEIREFLETHPKGRRKREARVAKLRPAVDAAEAKIGQQAEQLRSRLEKLQRKRWDPAKPPQRYLIDLAERIARPDDAERREPLPLDEGGTRAWQVAYRALLAWVLDQRGVDVEAQEQREAAIERAAGALENEGGGAAAEGPERKLLREAHALAWETQVTGEDLEDPGRRELEPDAEGSDEPSAEQAEEETR